MSRRLMSLCTGRRDLLVLVQDTWVRDGVQLWTRSFGENFESKHGSGDLD